MPTNPVNPVSSISQLPAVIDFTQVDFSLTNPTQVQNAPGVSSVTGTTIHYQEAGADAPAGTWLVDGKRLGAGPILMAKCYRGYLNNNDTIATYLSAMNVNTRFSRAANAFAASIREAAPSPNALTTKSYDELRTLATTHATEVGLSADAFLAQVLPSATAGSTYSPADWNNLADKVAQYSSAKLTDNSVLQQKLDTCTANRNALTEAMTGLLRAWTSFLQTLAKGL